MSDDIPYPEMLEFDWVKEFEEVKKNSKMIAYGNRKVSDIPPAPLSLVLTIIEEMHSRPEIWDIWVEAGLEKEFDDRGKNIMHGFYEYLDHKYGNETNAASSACAKMRKFASNYYAGLDDPNLIEDIQARKNVFDDRGNNYIQDFNQLISI